MALPAIIPTMDGTNAVFAQWDSGPIKMQDVNASRVDFTLRRQPGASTSRLRVRMDTMMPIYFRGADFKLPDTLAAEYGMVTLAQVRIGDFLDEEGLPPEDDPNSVPPSIDAFSSYYQKLKERSEASDNAVQRYLGAVLYWAYRFDQVSYSFSHHDAVRLGVTMDRLSRVSLVGEGDLWRRPNAAAKKFTFEPLPKLLRDFPQGVDQAQGHPVITLLAAARYAGARHAYEKSLSFLSANPPDFPNAAKEAMCAVEALARVVTGEHKRTLGEIIGKLRASKSINPALLKALESIWGYSSNAPGVRHGGPGVPTTGAAESRFVAETAASAMRLLLELDAR